MSYLFWLRFEVSISITMRWGPTCILNVPTSKPPIPTLEQAAAYNTQTQIEQDWYKHPMLNY
jgi:hypothetical protein